jgi:4-amino-4-deoxy-L-arabinose transferase-like glycosyltransferase
MFQFPQTRLAHYAVLLSVTAALFLPALGSPSLWDIDEGHNAETAREMLEAENWTVPVFNGELRVDKPILLYWLQLAAYRTFGVGELAARLPSALAAMLTVLLTYELGRRLFDPRTGLLGGLVLASSLLFCGSAHFANPDALLNACTVLTFLFFWIGFQRGNSYWLIWVGFSTGLGFLAKGPVALVLPGAVIGLFLLWQRELRRLWSVQLLRGLLVWALIAVPWFGLVGSETKGEFLRGFFLKHNVDRYLAPMEGHHGSIFYHVISLLLGFLPWSVFLGPALWYAFRKEDAQTRRHGDAENERSPRLRVSVSSCRFLLCWIAVYFVFFSLSQTKLPNYILPLYPAVALLTASFLERWRRGDLVMAGWLPHIGLVCWALVGVGLVPVLLGAAGIIAVPALDGRYLEGLEKGLWLAPIPIIGAAVASWFLQRQARERLLHSLTVSAVLFTGLVAIWAAPALDAFKAPRFLVEAAQARQLDREVRIGCFAYYQPSLVFYCQRQVNRLFSEQQAVEFLRSPLEVYLFVPADVWQGFEAKVPSPHRLLGRHRCLYSNCDVVVITNR